MRTWFLAVATSASYGAVARSIPLDLDAHFNNQGFGTYPGESAFNALNESYPAFTSYQHGNETFVSGSGIQYVAPGYRGASTPDNIICAGQRIALEKPRRAFAFSILHSSDVRKKTILGNITFTYSDNSTSTAELRSEPWWAFLAINRGDIVYDKFYTHNTTNFNSSHIFELEAALAPGKELAAITLPNTTNATTGRIHVFAASLWESDGPSVGVQSVKPTQKWIGDGDARSQVVEVIVNNGGMECVHGEGLTVSIKGNDVKTIEPGRIRRLCPGDQKSVQVSVTGSGACAVDVSLLYQNTTTTHTFSDLTFGLTNWTDANLAAHESPQWFDDAKFGIFIHWGPYAVPAWGNSTPYESYAEWFWWYTTHPLGDKSGFRDYRLRTYGPDLNYDDFFANFTAAQYDPKDWVDMIADAGAKYFVITTKHHDGFAMFDAGNTTNRTSLHYGPRRDVVRELFDAAKTYQPSLKRGTYFSLPEWFNPAWGPYGFAQYGPENPGGTTHPGIIARNPFTNATEPYTGFIPVDDFVQDVMTPQMEMLAYAYDTEMLWCDAGAANGTAAFARQWWNWAREAQGRDVAINSRCGTALVNDFDTPEYATFSTAQRRKWESNMGMDPFSYGYNRATPDDEYMNATTLVTTLVDMVSKNGNLLLNIGPRADGTIPQPEIDALREAGVWIAAHEEAVFNTTYWFQKAEVRDEKVNVRFTQTDDALYVTSLEEPVGGVLEVRAPVPILEGDQVSLLGVEDGEALEWSFDGDVFRVVLGDALVRRGKHAWVVKVEYVV
ncbi:alpha-L-fucosidase [Paraphaeosphaeria sporulosa]|uniref:alpha-L-fucosidase n=1 Tax=Paraphaeosphaeria sporulosa TaxID=1460663 RepID=A0A177CNY8_9PLEO|nr:alpha-L-fucosidase [Paraphaeosphaeria sporulosa]OAG09233.1 alpha-L-fucosidase [Paraphaeosphaeria sporulosa]